MGKPFSWKEYENVSKMLELIGAIVAVLGILTGIVIIILEDSIFRILGIFLIFGSALIAIYHYSFSFLMNGIREIMKQVNTLEE